MKPRGKIGVMFGAAVCLMAGFACGQSAEPLTQAELDSNPAYKKLMVEAEKSKDEFANLKSVTEALKAVEVMILRGLPAKIDEYTTLTNVKAGPGRTFSYDYIIDDGEPEPSFSAEDLEAAMRPQLEAQYRSDTMKVYHEGRVVITYRYVHAQGKLITEIVIGP